MKALNPFLIHWLRRYNEVKEDCRRAGTGDPTPQSVRTELADLFKVHVTTRPHINTVYDDYLPMPAYAAPVRIYHPRPGKPLPVLVYFHGGGMVAGGIGEYEPVCRKLALATDHIVVCPEYRLAPEAPYPAAMVDALGAMRSLPELLQTLGVKHQPVFSVAGDSCGAMLSTAVAARSRRECNVPVFRNLLITPCVDYTLSAPSVEQYGKGFMVEKELLSWCFDQYLPEGEERSALSPLFWEYDSSLPETMVITAEFSPMRDEGILFVDKLIEADVHVRHLHFEDMIQGFPMLENLVPGACRKLYEASAMFLQS